MPNPVAHFEIYGDNPTRLGEFYQKVFGWQIDAVPGMDYWMIKTVNTNPQGMPTEPGGINGGLAKRPNHEARSWLNYVTVPSLEAAVKQVQGSGGQVMRPKTPVPKMGWFAIVADPEMNVFGIWQNDPNAG
jgi:predicted enzyme related to lactoylglutathione lyase